MKRSLAAWLGLGVVVAASALFWGHVRHGNDGATRRTNVAAKARKAIVSGAVEARRQAAWQLALDPRAANREALEQALADQDAEVRRVAVLGLGWLKDPGSLSVIAHATTDPDPATRRDAAWALGELPDRRGCDALAPLIEDKEAPVARATVSALGRLDCPPSALVSVDDAHLQDVYFGRSVVSSLIRIKAPEALDVLERVAQSNLEHAFEFAAAIDNCRGIAFIVSTAAVRDDSQMNDLASRTLQGSAQPCTLDALLALSNGDIATRRQVATFLLALGSPKAMDALKQLQKDPDTSVAKVVTDGLAQAFKGRLAQPRDLVLLTKSSQDKDLGELTEQVSRARILRLLVDAGLTSRSGQLAWLADARGDKIVPPLLDRLTPTTVTNWRYEAALSAAADESALAALSQAAHHTNPNIREIVAQSLMRVAHPDARALLATLTGDPEPKVRKAAWYAYRRSAKLEAEDRIVLLLDSDRAKDVAIAYGALRFYPGAAAFAQALHDLESDDATRRDAASNMLTTVTGAQSRALLMRLGTAPKLRGRILDILRKYKMVSEVSLSRADIIPLIVDVLNDADPKIAEGMACVLSQVSGNLNPQTEAEYRRKGAAASLRKIVAKGSENGRACAKDALAAIGEDEGLLPLLDAPDSPYDFADWAKRLKGRVTVAMARRLIQRLTPDGDTYDTYAMDVLKTASPEVLGQSYVPALCEGSSTVRARLERISLTWGVPDGIAKLGPGSERQRLVTWIHTALVAGTDDDRILAAKLIVELRDAKLIDTLLALAQKLREGRVWEGTLDALAEIGEVRALPLILQALATSKPPGYLRRYLRWYDDPRARAALLSAATGIEERNSAVDDLAGLLPDEQWALLVQRVNADCGGECSCYQWRTLSLLKVPTAAADLGAPLCTPGNIEYNIALRGDRISSDALFALLAALDTDKCPAAMRRWKSPETLDLLLAAMNHPSPKVRSSAARCLADWQAPGALGPLVAALDDPISAVRVAAASSLGVLQDLNAEPYLGDFLAQWPPKSPEFASGLCAWASLRKHAAAKALSAYTSRNESMDDIASPVIRALGCTRSAAAIAPLSAYLERYEYTTLDAIRALGSTSQPAAAAPLLKLVQDGPFPGRAMSALSDLASPDALAPVLTELELLSPATEDSYRDGVIHDVSKYKDARAVDALMKGLTNARCSDAVFYVSTLAKMHDKRAIPALEQTGQRCRLNFWSEIREISAN